MKTLDTLVFLSLLDGCAKHSPVRYVIDGNQEVIRYDVDGNGVAEHITVFNHGTFGETGVERLTVADSYDFDQDGQSELLFVSVYGRRDSTDVWKLVATTGLKEGE